GPDRVVAAEHEKGTEADRHEWKISQVDTREQVRHEVGAEQVVQECCRVVSAAQPVVELQQLLVEADTLAVDRQHTLEVAIGDIADVEAGQPGTDVEHSSQAPLAAHDLDHGGRQLPPPASSQGLHEDSCGEESQSQQRQTDIRGAEETIGVPQREVEVHRRQYGDRSDEDGDPYGESVGPSS